MTTARHSSSGKAGKKKVTPDAPLPPVNAGTPTTPTPTPTPTPAPTGPSPSGIPMPTAKIANWTPVMLEDFNTPCAEGQFLSVYGPRNWSAYPTSYKDTRSKNVSLTNVANYGTYDPNIISVPADAGYMQIKFRDGSDGSRRVAAPVPKLDPAVGLWGDILSARVSVCFRTDICNTRKVAWLMWPASGGNTTGATAGTKDSTGKYIGGNGEIDGPEADLYGGDNISMFIHWQNGTTGGSQTQFTSNTDAANSGWHVLTWEWIAGVSMYAWLDGVAMGGSPLLGAKVPATKMHYVLQCETILNTATALVTTNGSIYLDWFTAHKYTPGS